MKTTNGSGAKVQRYHGHRILILAASVLAAGAWWMRRRPFRVIVKGPSMSPTLEPGDLLMAVTNGIVRAGSLVVVQHPDRPAYEMVKRVEALPRDRVGERLLRQDEYWVSGDNPEESTDSRSFGPVTGQAIKGVVRARYWPASRVAWFD